MTDTTKGVTRRLAEFIVNTEKSDIPEVIFDHAKVAFMDWLGVTLAGKDDPLVLKLLQHADLMGGNEHASILGHGKRTSVEQAALINGSASHALDYDDTLAIFLGHPSVAIFPGLLCLSEFKKRNGADFLSAYLVGFKAGAVVSACTGGEHYMAGFHATATMGALAATAT
ncbi:MAG: MmgE/PrpD family protein, partial [Desulfobacterales bacterium]|nr:MmgE/PrpD family protein [Desulfobacterales bacterium]